MKNRKEIDWVGMWFALAKERGGENRSLLGKTNIKTKKTTWFEQVHSEMDGLGVFVTCLRNEGYNIPELPKAKKSKKPSFWKRPLIIFKALQNMKSGNIPWKEHDFEKKTVFEDFKSELKWIYFTKKETDKIKNYCRSQGISLMSLHIQLLNNVVVPKLVNGDYAGSWMMPINMRGNVEMFNETGNYISAFMIQTTNKTTAKDMQQQIKGYFKSDLHWGNWWLSNIGKIIGISGMRWYAKRFSKKVMHLGSCTTIGEWPSPGTEKKDYNPDELWIGCPPGSGTYPIGSFHMIWYGILTMSLKIHPSVLSDNSKSEEYIQELKAKLLEMVK